MDYKDFFAEIDRHLFPNTDVKQISEMNDDEQRAFMLQQVDKLLEQRHFEEMEWCVNMLWEEKHLSSTLSSASLWTTTSVWYVHSMSAQSVYAVRW